LRLKKPFPVKLNTAVKKIRKNKAQFLAKIITISDLSLPADTGIAVFEAKLHSPIKKRADIHLFYFKKISVNMKTGLAFVQQLTPFYKSDFK